MIVVEGTMILVGEGAAAKARGILLLMVLLVDGRRIRGGNRVCGKAVWRIRVGILVMLLMAVLGMGVTEICKTKNGIVIIASTTTTMLNGM